MEAYRLEPIYTTHVVLFALKYCVFLGFPEGLLTASLAECELRIYRKLALLHNTGQLLLIQSVALFDTCALGCPRDPYLKCA